MRATKLIVALLDLNLGLAQDRPTFRADVSLVHVDVEVRNKDGRVLTGFSKPDFQVFEDGHEQPLVGFSGEDQSLDLILLFDVSSSMQGAITAVREAAHRALLELRRNDRVSVMTFNDEAREVARFTQDEAAIEAAIARLLESRFGGSTRIHDAVDQAAKQFMWSGERNQRRRAVLIITDNLGRPGHESRVIEDLWEADAVLCGLVTRNSRSLGGLLASKGVRLPGGIERIAGKTGGETIRSNDMASAFPEMMHRIRSRYSLYYRLPEGNQGAVRRIEVELSADCRLRFPDARIAARQGYRAGVRNEHGLTDR